MIGIDWFMSEAPSVTNIIGNSLASVIIAKMSGEFDPAAAEDAYAEALGPGVRFPASCRRCSAACVARRASDTDSPDGKF